MEFKSELIEKQSQEQSELEYQQVVELFGRLAELFPFIKQMQPQIESMYCGMGMYGFMGKTKKQYWDGYWIENKDKMIRKVPKKLVGKNNYDDVRVYEGYDNEGTCLSDYIEDFLNGTTCEIEATLDFFINDEMIEFYHLCNYMCQMNWTTYFDGVNENGVIVSHGKGCVHDTYTDARCFDGVEHLYNADIPIVFYDATKNVYSQYEHIVE